MSQLKARCERIRDEVTLESFFNHMGWDYREKGRINCVWPEHDDRSPAMQIYPDNQSVYCFACSKGGDVIALVQGCVSPGEEMPLMEAVRWLEETFGLGSFSAPVKARSRVSKKLARWRQKQVESPNESHLDLSRARRDIDHLFIQVEEGVPHWILLEADAHKRYIQDSCPTSPEGVVTWAAWARAHIVGSYSSFLKSMQIPWDVPVDIIDDRPETIAAALHWDTHRAGEYNSDWPLYVP